MSKRAAIESEYRTAQTVGRQTELLLCGVTTLSDHFNAFHLPELMLRHAEITDYGFEDTSGAPAPCVSLRKRTDASRTNSSDSRMVEDADLFRNLFNFRRNGVKWRCKQRLLNRVFSNLR